MKNKEAQILEFGTFWPLQLSLLKKTIRKSINHIGLVYGVKRHFQQYFSYIVVVSFIGGGNRSTRRKPETCRKSLTNYMA
jgi:hypothetical protein